MDTYSVHYIHANDVPDGSDNCRRAIYELLVETSHALILKTDLYRLVA